MSLMIRYRTDSHARAGLMHDSGQVVDGFEDLVHDLGRGEARCRDAEQGGPIGFDTCGVQPLELRAMSTGTDPRPFAGRDFQRTDRLFVRLSLYGTDVAAAVT